MANMWFAHRGFIKVWKVIEPYLEDVIADPKIKKIFIAGYSHGAALALLCHEYCRFHRPDIEIEGYGFGCPRVVWGFLRKKIKKRFEGFHVIKNCKDIVTHLPPVIFGFRNVGEMIKVGKKEKYSPVDSHRHKNYLTELEKYDKEHSEN